MLNSFLGMLTDVFNKLATSNIGKLFSIVSDECDALHSTLSTIQDWRAIDNAAGTTLDDIGDDINQPRGRATDEIYRIMLKAKLVRGDSDGTYNKIIDSLAKTINCPPSDITVMSSVEQGEGEPMAIVVDKAPLDELNRVGMSGTQFAQIVQQVVAADVAVSRTVVQGSFSFASGSALENDAAVGFANAAQTTGGTLGGVFTSESDYELPIGV
ncbi:MAG: hypothetical protein ABF969_04300 [Sporolactobacillus sp.]